MANFFDSLFGKKKFSEKNSSSTTVAVINAVEVTTINNITDVIVGNMQPEEALNDIAQQGARAAINDYVTHQLPSDSSLRNVVLNSVNGEQSLDDALADMIQQKAQIIVNDYVKAGTHKIMPQTLADSSFENTVTTNIVDIIIDNKELGDALSDIAEEGAKTAISRCLQVEDVAAMTEILTNSTDAVHTFLKAADVPGEVLISFMESKDVLLKWAIGEMPTHRCLLDLGQKAAALSMSGYTATIGQVLIPIPIVGAAIGNMIGSALTSGLYQQLTADLQRREREYQAREERTRQYRFVAEAEKKYRQELERYLKEYLTEYRQYFNNALSQIDKAFAAGDADGIIQGANQITRKLGGTVHYETVSEFKSFLLSDEDDVL